MVNMHELFFGTGKRRRSLTPGEKNYLVRVSRGKCEYCDGDIIGKGITPNIHHIVEFASRGSDGYHNLIVLCPNCHSRVDQISKEALRAKIEYRLPKKASDANTATSAVITKKTTPQKSTAKKTTAKKVAPKKIVAKKTTAKKVTPKKTAAKKTTARKTTPAKRTTAKR